MAVTNSRFVARRQQILKQLGVPDGEYHDFSPKGSVDEPIRGLIGEINALDGLVTTSSCSGRISVFLEGRKAGPDDPSPEESEESRAGPGGKGGGGAWLFISHDPVDRSEVEANSTWLSKFNLELTTDGDSPPTVDDRYIHLKFEPMILHILTSSTEDAQRTLSAALSAGFRESGAVSLTSARTAESTPIVAVRSAGYSFDSIIGYQKEDGQNIAMVNEQYLRTLIDIANDRFRINHERIARFRHALMEAFQPSTQSAGKASKPDWEDADARKRRKREEGLARQRALQEQKAEDDSKQTESMCDMGSLDLSSHE